MGIDHASKFITAHHTFLDTPMTLSWNHKKEITNFFKTLFKFSDGLKILYVKYICIENESYKTLLKPQTLLFELSIIYNTI